MVYRAFARLQARIPAAMEGLHSDTHNVIISAKQQMRQRMKTASEKVPPEQIVNESRILADQVLSSEWYRRSSRLSIYVSTFGEANTTSIIRESILNGKQVFIPNFQRNSNKMDMLRVASEEEFENLEAVLWGIRQHTNPCDELSWRHSGALDVIVVPGVAFTIEGQRLGHGKGFYDRFIAEHRQMFSTTPLTVALALSYQIVESLPTTVTDAPIDHVLMPIV